ncbi:MAG: TRAM domain-containing protein [Ancrocorticia sp.]|nr:TRAM domain-containing protein [Ancrocorticia sp.]
MSTTVDVELADVAHGGYCVGREPSGRAVFVRFGLPGERVRVVLTKEKKKLAMGDAVEVLDKPSEHRVPLRWPAAGPLGVGGADLGHVAFDYQSTWKTHVLRQAIRRVGGEALERHITDAGIEPTVEALLSDRPTQGWENRTRFECVIDDHGKPAMYREGSHELVAISEMPLAVPEAAELDVFGGAWRNTWHPGERIRAVVPSGSDPVLVIEKQVFAFPGIPADQFVREDVVIGHELYTYRVHAAGFWQVHRDAAAQLTRLVLNAAQVEPGDAVVEFYSGAGLLSQPLALATGAKGTLRTFEGVLLAVEDARANLREFPWVTTRTSAVTPQLIEWEPGDVVVADPPRAGLGQERAAALAASPARRVVLISCDPAAMARDAAAMVAAGRTIRSMRSIDMFPNTHHFEIITALS